MATLVQRTPSMPSVQYLRSKQEPSTMDADAEICRLFGSLNLTATPSFVQPQVVSHSEPVITYNDAQTTDTSMSIESDMASSSSSQGDCQTAQTSPSASPKEPETIEIEGCGLVQMLAAYYSPRLVGLSNFSHSPDSTFNLLENILMHREAFVAFPYGHRTCSNMLTKVAFEIERRHHEGEAFSEGADIDTAIALHNEAWLMSGL